MQSKQLVILLCLLAVPAASQNSPTSPAMSHEEAVVRSAYAKLAYATQIEVIREAVDDWDLRPGSVDWAAFSNRSKDGEITFQLHNIRVGDFSDIANVKYADLVTKPNGQDILSVAHARWTFSTDEPKSVAVDTAQPVWIKAQTLTEDWNIPFAEAFKIMQAGGAEDFSGYHRYAALDVTVTFQGHATSYHALFFFGKSANTGEKVLVVDTVTGGSALNIFLHSSVYPATLLETDIRNIPFVSQWLKNDIVPTSAAGKHQVTCDLYTLNCGLASEDVQRALGSKPAAKLPAHPIESRAHVVEASFHPRLEGTLLMQSDPCSLFNFNSGPTPGSTPFDQQQHSSGGHFMNYNQSSSCAYTTGNNSNGACNTACRSSVGGSASESGGVTGFCHVAQISQQVGGTGQANGAAASCNSAIALGVKACLLCGCSVTFSISGSGTGGTGSIAITSDGFYTFQQNNSQTCSQETTQTAGGGGGPSPDPCLNSATVGGPTGQDVSPTCSPLIIDIGEEGFHLTSARAGVTFDITGTGRPVQIAWTDPHYRNALLALPGPDGLVHDGKQLFGNFTPQPPSDRPNGFLALAQYDKPVNGGNGDGIIDQRDAVYSRLRLWIDDNHDGISQPSELHTLSELGVSSIGLLYHFSYLEDQYGNVFRYRARVNPEPPNDQAEVGKAIYDVFLTTTK